MEQYLICHCAPTLASIKTANLFSCAYCSEEDLASHIRCMDRKLRAKGIRLLLLQKKNGRALIYVFRPKRLQQDLKKPGVAEFLGSYGYEDLHVAQALRRLHERIMEAPSFPHEIGIFLDYPLEDVIGFIDNGGCNCKCCGCWKVYANEEDALATFARYAKCTRIYTDLWMRGSSVTRLAVSA